MLLSNYPLNTERDMASIIATGRAMPILPCAHDPDAIRQIDSTKTLLREMDKRYPDVLLAEGVRPVDYHAKLVFRSAVESIRGTYIASSQPARHKMVADVLERLCGTGKISGFKTMGSKKRYDFVVEFSSKPKVCAALEVKGGEGNSINISDRPPWAEEFVLWCHLDGAIVNQPTHGIGQIIFNRVTKELVERKKLADAILVKDAICGTPLRPCPKYAETVALENIAPDVYLLPQSVPTASDPRPPVHTQKNLRLPFLILGSFGIRGNALQEHVYDVNVELVPRDGRKGKRFYRRVTVERWDRKLREDRLITR